MSQTSQTIAVIGASSDHRKFGNKCVRAYQKAGYEVYPVNLSEDEVEGLPVHRNVGDVPVDLDLIALYLPPPRTLRVLRDIAAKGARQGVFFNPGTYDAEVLEKAQELGVPVRVECAIVALGMSPGQFP
ncbi:MAG TPA: CoA-binding protein [Thermoanaerobaculia bacterium]|nr:CoA-binding protein [Thermoanaerobaculia bacterium]